MQAKLCWKGSVGPLVTCLSFTSGCVLNVGTTWHNIYFNMNPLRSIRSDFVSIQWSCGCVGESGELGEARCHRRSVKKIQFNEALYFRPIAYNCIQLSSVLRPGGPCIDADNY